MLIKSCIGCHKSFQVHPYREKTARYCSGYCLRKYRNIFNPIIKKRFKKFCQFCNKEFFVYPYQEKIAKYCSLSCKSKDIQINHPELREKLPHKFGKEHHHWNGGKWVDPQGYVHLRLPNYPQSNPRGYYREHRYVMEQHLSRFLKRSEHIHHINCDKTDNRIENLLLFKNAKDHANYHISLNGKAHN